MPHWTAENIPDQTGRIVLITGANSGLGLESARILASKNAQVIMACRNVAKGEEARAAMPELAGNGGVSVMALDLGRQESIRSFTTELRTRFDQIDILINNAGLMAIPFGLTPDGFETQFGVNHLGHFTLTGLLLDRMLATPGSRVVTVSSSAAWMGSIRLQDPNFKQGGYRRYLAYGQSKLANLLFARELDRRLRRAGAQTRSLAAQPGYVYGQLQERAAGGAGLEQSVYSILGGLSGHDVRMGALSQLRAATDPAAEGGEFYNPNVLLMRGYPVVLPGPAAGRDEKLAERLWELSETLTGVTYPFAT